MWRSVPQKAIKNGKCRASVSRRQPSNPSGSLIGLDWTFGDSVDKTTMSTPHSGCQRFRPDPVTSHESNQYHQDVNPSLLLAMQKASKVALSMSLLSKPLKICHSDLVNKFSIVAQLPWPRSAG
jgi:hypothetical protein